MEVEFDSFSNFQSWIDDIKTCFSYKLFISILAINSYEIKNIQPDESHINIYLHQLSENKWYKAVDSRKPFSKEKTPFELMVLEILDTIKKTFYTFAIKCNLKHNSKISKKPDIKMIQYYNNKHNCEWFNSDGNNLTARILIEDVTKFTDMVNKFKNEVNYKLIVDYGNANDSKNFNMFSSADKYVQMRNNLYYWLDYTYIEIELPYYAQPLLNLIKIIFAGLGAKNTNAFDSKAHNMLFHNFLTKGLYDPRLFLIIERFLRL